MHTFPCVCQRIIHPHMPTYLQIKPDASKGSMSTPIYVVHPNICLYIYREREIERHRHMYPWLTAAVGLACSPTRVTKSMCTLVHIRLCRCRGLVCVAEQHGHVWGSAERPSAAHTPNNTWPPTMVAPTALLNAMSAVSEPSLSGTSQAKMVPIR